MVEGIKVYQGEISQSVMMGRSKFRKRQYQSLNHNHNHTRSSRPTRHVSIDVARTRKIFAIFAAHGGGVPVFTVCSLFFISGEFGGMEGCSM